MLIQYQHFSLQMTSSSSACDLQSYCTWEASFEMECATCRKTALDCDLAGSMLRLYVRKG
jgi:hypothetical protein